MTAGDALTSAEPAGPRNGARPLADRLLAAVPLATLYVWLSAIYAVEAWGHKAPWLFPDELQTTQLARSVADTGHAALRGQPHSFDSLYTYFNAPFWLIHDTVTAYEGIRYANVLAMTSVVFPTYLLARLVVGKRAALFAAAGAGVIPSLAYSGYLVQENLAYPYSTLSIYLIARALVAVKRGRAQRRWVAAAVLSALLGPVVRGELSVLLVVIALSACFAAWSSEWGRERRAAWPWADRVGAWLLIAGAVFFVMALAGAHSSQWLESWTFYRHRIVNMLNWAVGAVAIGVAVVPLVLGLASLVRAPGERTTWELRVFRSTLFATLIGYALYTGVKAAFLSAHFATRVEERNLIYVVPPLFVGMALVLERRAVNRWALGVAGAFAVYLVGYALYHPTQYPYEMRGLYSDSLGLAILSNGSSLYGWSPDFARLLLLAIALGTLAAAAAITHRRVGRRAALALTVVLCAGVVGWSFTGELAAASESNGFARAFAQIVSPDGGSLNWVDKATKGAPTLYEGVGENDPNAEWTLEFLNRSLVRIGSLDGTILGPGPSGAPNIAPDGLTYWVDTLAEARAGIGPQYDYVVEDYPCVDFAGTYVLTHWHLTGAFSISRKPWRLVKLARPNRLRAECNGLYPDGWSGANDSGYFRFSGPAQGWLRVVVSRRDWGGPTPPSPVRVLLGKLVIPADREAHLGAVSRRYDLSIASAKTKVVWIPITQSRFAVRVLVAKKFVPHDYDPSNFDTRQLGAEVTYQVFSKLPAGAKPATPTG